MQTQIRLLLEEQSDQGLHCLSFNLLLTHHTAQKFQTVQFFGWFQYLFQVSEFSELFTVLHQKRTFVDSQRGQELITLGSYNENNTSFRSDRNRK